MVIWRWILTDEKKVPDDIPVPDQLQGESSQEGGGSDAPQLTVEQLEGLLNGSETFQNFFNLSDEVLLAWASQGYAFYQQGKYLEAETIFKGLVTLNSQVAYYHTALGSIYEAQDKYDEALEEFNLALVVDEKDICALVNRGEIRLRKGQVLEAAQDFQAAITYDEANMEEQKKKKEKPTPDPAAQRARALSMVTFEVLQEIEKQVKAQTK